MFALRALGGLPLCKCNNKKFKINTLCLIIFAFVRYHHLHTKKILFNDYQGILHYLGGLFSGFFLVQSGK
jgi:hypothetical protein